MIAVAYDPSIDAISISNTQEMFLSKTLVADAIGDDIVIRRINSDQRLVFTRFDQITNTTPSGVSFASAAECLSYLRITFDLSLTRVPILSIIADEAISIGYPVCLSRATGRAIVARSRIYATSFVCGLASETVEAGLPITLTRASMTLDDWSHVCGSVSLKAGFPYFLMPDGGIDTVPVAGRGTGSTNVRVGHALSGRVLTFSASDPILL